MKPSNAALAFLVAVLLGTVVIGCQSDGPLSVQSNPVVSQEPDFLKLPRHLSLHKIVGDTALITPQNGGVLKLDFKYRYVTSTGDQEQLSLKLRLTFPRGAVDDSIIAIMRLDDEVLRSNVDITFNPHGSTFLKPAILDMDVRGMDVAGLSPRAKIWLYYDDNGTWVKMEARRIEFNYNQGEIKCDNGELPHFSRYAFGR